MSIHSIYKDPMLMTAQILSIFAFVLSFGGVIAIVMGLTAMIVLQVVWCARLGKVHLNITASLAAVVSLIDLIWAIVLVVRAEDACVSSDCAWEAWAAMLFVSSALWMIVSCLVFRFTNSERFEKCYSESENHVGPPVLSTTTSTAAPVVKVLDDEENNATQTNVTSTLPGTTQVETQEFHDGTKKTISTTIHADGSKTVQETIEKSAASRM